MQVLKIVIFFYFALIMMKNTHSQDGFISGTPALSYWTLGDHSEIVIVLHGGPGAAHNYLRPEWDSLSKVAKVIYYDQRGSGKSEKSDCYSWQMQVQDLKRVINTFSAGKKVILAGSSWGTVLALLYAYTFPEDVKAMILSGTVSWRGKGGILKDCSFYMPKPKKGNALPIDTLKMYKCLKGDYIIQPASKMTPALEEMISLYKCYEMNSLHTAFINNSLRDAPLLPQLKKVHMPVLIFESGGDCYTNERVKQFLKDGTRQFKGLLPGLTVYSIKDACHDPWFTHKKIFFQKCIAFVKQVQ